MYYCCLRKLLFLLPPELAHRLTLPLLSFFHPAWWVRYRQKSFRHCPVEVCGITFPNPVGLAAGMDKDGNHIDAWFGLGFGFVELGGVTPLPQKGNRKPRLHRLPKANALINCMGFNNKGVDHLVERLQKRRVPGIVGINIGKNLATPLETAYTDYAICFGKVYAYADFVTINISSPNTEGLRKLQGETYLQDLLTRLKALQQELEQQYQKKVPLFVKVSPDLSDDEIASMALIFLDTGVDGVIATNTSTSRSGVEHLSKASKAGGLSGRPILNKTQHVVARFHQILENQIPIIAVGGIFSPEDARLMFEAGASLVQLYTGLIYQGPQLVTDIVSVH